MGAEIAIKPGSHSFVRVPGEDFIRASRTRSLFGEASGHGMLSDEKPVLFAGEVEISKDSQLIRWNNVSGTYKFPQQHAVQVELPLDRFWGLVEDLEVPMRAEDSADWVCLCNGLWLQRYEETALSEQVSQHPALLNTSMLHSSERLSQAWSCEEVYTSLFDVSGPSAIGEIKEDGDKLKTAEQMIGELDTLGTSVDASAAEANVEMAADAAGQFRI